MAAPNSLRIRPHWARHIQTAHTSIFFSTHVLTTPCVLCQFLSEDVGAPGAGTDENKTPSQRDFVEETE